MIFAGDYDSARLKGVEHLFLQFGEGGFFDRVVLVSPYLRRRRCIQLDERHRLLEFGLAHGILQRLLAPVHLLRVVLACRRIVRDEGVCLIRATEPTLCALLAWAVARLSRIPYCVSLHADYDKRFLLDPRHGAPVLFGSRALTRYLEAFTLRRALRVLPIRESLTPYVTARGVDPRKIRVIPHGIDLTLYQASAQKDVRNVLGLERDKALLVFAGRLEPENYVGDLLEIASRLVRRRGDDFILVLAGRGSMEPEVRTRMEADPQLARVIRLVGFVSQDVIRSLRAASSLSLCLMGGFSLIEACAAGRPVIAYDVEWHHELVIDGRTGHLLKEHDVEGVAGAVSALLDSPAAAARMGEEARRLVFSRHSLARTQAIKRAVYREVIDRLLV